MKVNDLGEHSDWIYEPPAADLFSIARSRVFQMNNNKRPTKKKKNSDGAESSEQLPKYTLNLEQNPKWGVLKEILNEIFIKIKQKKENSNRVLVLVRDISTCNLIQEYLKFGGKVMLENRWKNYLNRKSFLKKTKWYSKSSTRSMSTRQNKNTSTSKTKLTGRRNRKDPTQKTIIDLLQVKSETETSESDEILDDNSEKKEEEEEEETEIIVKEEKQENIVSMENDENSKDIFEEIKNCFQVVEEPNVIVQPYGNKRVLDEIMPKYIILYDPDVGFIRQLETYQALHPKIRLKIYFMLYEESVEEQQYLTVLNKENQAFDALIRAREVSLT